MKGEEEEQMNIMMKSVNAKIGKFTIEKLLSKGSTAHVFEINTAGEIKALKVIWKKNKQPKQNPSFKQVEDERTINEIMNHPNIVKQFMHFSDAEHHYLMLEICEKGTLTDLIKENKAIKARNIIDIKNSREEFAKNTGKEILKGIIYLHANNIVHGDLRPENILLNKKNEIKICDFGQSVRLKVGEKTKIINQQCNGFLAPEILTLCDHKIDIWAFGCLLFLLATDKYLFKISSYREFAHTFSSSFTISLPNELSPELSNLLKKIFVYHPDHRISAQEILNHEFFIGVSLKENISENIIQTDPKRAITVTTLTMIPEIKKRKSSFSTTSIKINKDNCKKLSPINVIGLKVKPIIMNTVTIRIDEKGLTREQIINDSSNNVLILNVNASGDVITIKKKNKERTYLLEELPEKYHKYYENCKDIVKIVKDQTPRVSYETEFVSMNVMHNGRVCVRIEGKELTYSSESLFSIPTSSQLYPLKEIYKMLLSMPLLK